MDSHSSRAACTTRPIPYALSGSPTANSVIATLNQEPFVAETIGGIYEPDGSRWSWGIGSHKGFPKPVGIYVLCLPGMVNGMTYQLRPADGPLQLWFAFDLDEGLLFASVGGEGTMTHDLDTSLVQGRFAFVALGDDDHEARVAAGTLNVGPSRQPATKGNF
jgi:hypothetical protein